MSKRAVIAAAIAVAILVAATWLHLLESYYVGLLTEALILGIFAMSLDLLIGFLGLDSLGHAAFLGMGAYVGALLSLHGVDNVFWLLGAAVAAAMLLGAVIGAVALRAVGPYFLMITMALGYLPWALAIRWRALTGGDDGLPGLFRPDLGAGISLDSGRNYFTFVAIVFVACHAAMAALGRSSFGYALRGIKDSAVRMETLGYNVWWLKFSCAIIAAGFAGIAGVLIGFYNGFVSPNDLSIYRSVEAMVAVILGGAGTLIGPAIAAGVILMVRLGVSALTTHWAIVLGALYIGVVILAPRGFAFAWRDIAARLRKIA